MTSTNKLGTYIQKLMTTVIDSKEDDFVKELAWDELKRLNADVEEFLRKNQKDDSDVVEKTIEKQLLLEKEKNGNN